MSNLGLALGRCRGQEMSRVSTNPPQSHHGVLGGGIPQLWGAWGPPLTVPSRCRWGEEQLPDGQIQKYWVSVWGRSAMGCSRFPAPLWVSGGCHHAESVPCPLCRRRPTRGARSGARAAAFASPAASTSARWRLSWWEFGAASARRTCPTSDGPVPTAAPRSTGGGWGAGAVPCVPRPGGCVSPPC